MLRQIIFDRFEYESRVEEGLPSRGNQKDIKKQVGAAPQNGGSQEGEGIAAKSQRSEWEERRH